MVQEKVIRKIDFRFWTGVIIVSVLGILFHFVYESIMLALPIQVLHPDDENGNSTCNPEILKIMNEHSPDAKKEDEIDPRWEALKKLK